MRFLRNRFYTICFSVMLFLGLYLSVFQSVMNEMSDMLGFDGVFSGVIIAFHFLGALIMPTVAGELGDRIGKRGVLLGAALAMTVGVVIIAFSRHIAPMGFGIFLIGAGSCTLEGLLSAKITDEDPQNAEKLMNYSQIFFCVGAVVGPLLVLAVRRLGGAWHVNLYVIALLLLFVIAFLRQLPAEKKIAQVKSGSRKAFSFALLKDGRFLLFFFAMMLYVGAEGGTAFFIIGYFNEVDLVGIGEISLSLFWGSMILGRWLAGTLYRYADKIMLISLGFSIVISVLLQWMQPSMGTAVLFFLLGLGMSAIWPLLMASCTRIFRHTSGTAGGLMMASGALGGMLMPMLVGWLSGDGGVRGAFVAVTGGMVLALLLNVCLQKMKFKSSNGKV